jgi:hypothetical protein
MVMPRGLGRNTQQPLLTYKSSSQQQNQADFTKQLVDLGILSKAPDVRMTAQQRDQFTGGRQDTPQDFYRINMDNPIFDPIFGGSITPEGIAAALGTLPPSILQDRNLLTKRLGPLARFFMGARRFDTAGNFAGFEQPDPIGQPNFQAIRPAPRV